MIKQLYSSAVLHGNSYRPDHHGNFKKGYNLVDYYDPDQPAIFYGCYNKNDYNIIMKHRAGGIVIWGGTDVIYMKKHKYRFGKNIRHISLSRGNLMELKKYGIKSEHRVLLKADPEIYKLRPLGKKVYVYMPFKRRRFYGFDTINKLSKRMDVEFVITRWGRKTSIPNATTYPLLTQRQLRKVYEDVLCCIRPTMHDGFPQSFLELGLMGRRCAWPHEPGLAVQCKNLSGYINFIKNEQNRTRPHSDIRDMVIRLCNKDFLNWF